MVELSAMLGSPNSRALHALEPGSTGMTFAAKGLLESGGERVLHHHLIPTSLWRRKSFPSSLAPKRAGLASLVIPALPRVQPFALESGKLAYVKAREGALRALDTELV